MEFLSKQECSNVAQQMKSKFPSYPFYMVESKNFKGVKELGAYLKKVAQDSLLKLTIPSVFVAVRDWLVDAKLDGQKFMTKKEFSSMVHPMEATREADCLKYLIDTGTILYVKDVEDDSKSLLLLDPSFVIETWTQLVSSSQIIQERFFPVSEIRNQWNHIPSDIHPYLLQTFVAFHKVFIVDGVVHLSDTIEFK